MSTTSAATSQPSSRQAAGAAVGPAVGPTAVAFTVALPDAAAYVYLGAQLAGVGWIYFGFGVADGRPSAIAVQALSAAAFITVGYLGA